MSVVFYASRAALRCQEAILFNKAVLWQDSVGVEETRQQPCKGGLTRSGIASDNDI